MRTALFGEAAFDPAAAALPIMIHGKEGSGASLFSVVLAAAFARQRPLVFWSAYPMAKKEFRDELGDAARGAAIIEEGDPGLLSEALASAAPDAALFVKNFETLPAALQARLAAHGTLIASGDMEGLAVLPELSRFPTRIHFSPLEGAGVPELRKYEGFARTPEGERFVRLA